jgi:hypothetical protein
VAISLNKLYVRTFERSIRHLSQQTDARLRPWVMEATDGGSTHNWRIMGEQTMAAKAGGRVATPANDSVYSNRISTIATYHGGDTTEQEDINQLLLDPKSSIATALGNAARRQVDKIVLAAATGTALDEAGANNALPAGSIFGDGLGEITFDAVTAINEMFLAANIPADEPKVFIIGPKQARKILHMVQATQSFYVGQALQLVNGGFVKDWMGFTWIVSTLLNKPTPGTNIDCVAMTGRAIGLQVSKDIWARVAEDPSVSFAWRIYTAMAMGAVRVEDSHVVKAFFKDSVTIA